jgi:hypothetical protein
MLLSVLPHSYPERLLYQNSFSCARDTLLGKYFVLAVLVFKPICVISREKGKSSISLAGLVTSL